jgi:predicted enzyme related to lactoylglutathione lyase
MTTGTTTGMRTVIHPVKDLAGAKTVFGALLGIEPVMDEPYYVGFDVAGQHVGLDPNGHAKGMTGPVAYWHVDDVQATLDRLLAAGAEPDQPVSDVGGGKLVATVRDADGNPIGLIQAP